VNNECIEDKRINQVELVQTWDIRRFSKMTHQDSLLDGWIERKLANGDLL
jgi:hypothetical protein